MIGSAQHVASAFKNSPLQYAILREHEFRAYGKYIAFIQTVITRWGTQAGLIRSILAN